MSVPGPPIVVPAPKCGDQQLDFYWSPPTFYGDSALSSYTLSCSSITFSSNIGASTFTNRVLGLANRTDYAFTLAANNEAGQGPPAAFRTVQTGAAPHGPSTVNAMMVDRSTIMVNWAPSTSLAEAIGNRWFVIKALPSTAQGVYSTFQYPAYFFTSSALIGPLSTNNYYNVLVQAVNDVGYAPSNAYLFASSPTLIFATLESTITLGSNYFMVGGRFATTTNATRPFLIQRSADGINWVSSVAVGSSTFGSQYNKGSFNGSSLWVWSGGDGVFGGFIHSSNGFDWKGCLGGLPTGTGYFTYYNPYKNLWIGGGNGGQSSNSLQWSSDGITWNPSRTNLNWFYGWGAAYSSTLDIYVAVGFGNAAAAWSTDGSNWTWASTSGASIGYSVVWNEHINKFIAGFNVGGAWSTVQTSTDGKNFINAIPATAITFNGCIGVGYNSSITLVGGGSGGQVFQSADAVTWVSSKVGMSSEMADFKYHSNINMWVAAGTNTAAANERVKYSGNGCNWSNPTYTNFSSMSQQAGVATAYTYTVLSTIIV